MAVSRRAFLKNGGIAMIGMSTLPAFLQRAIAATAAPSGKKLVVLFQRGAADGLNIVVPFGEPNYYRIRPSIAISAAPAPAPRVSRLISTASSVFIPASCRSCRCFRKGNSPSCTPPARRTQRARISMHRTTWSPARPA